jgi:hypothetical protein
MFQARRLNPLWQWLSFKSPIVERSPHIVVSVFVALVIGVLAALGGSAREASMHAQAKVRNGVIHACVETRPHVSPLLFG